MPSSNGIFNIPQRNFPLRDIFLRRHIENANKSLAEFALASAKKVGIIFSGGVYVGENTARLANVRRVRRRRALRAMQRAAAFSNESPVKRVSFESLSKTLF